ncbi:hypothetical protein [Selenomonas montiformis]|uniref:hypothetical protein n=1 Tax=Selenomonas montiformis TaxID=2652285 RepID=UPI0039F557AA
MNTLIVPCAENQYIEDDLVCVKRHPQGSFFVEQCLSSLELNQFDSVIIALGKTENNRFQLLERLKKELGKYKNVSIEVLPCDTKGSAETVYQVIREKKIQGEIVIKDSTSSLVIPNDCYHKNFIIGINLSCWKDDIHDIRRKSFIKVNEQSQVLDIIEKDVQSNIISVGMYGFKHADDYVQAYKRLNDKNYSIERLYISHIISYLIGACDKVFHFVPAISYEEWSSRTSWMNIQKKYANYFLDLDALFGPDLDVHNCEETIRSIKRISCAGATFIAFTSHDESMKKKMKALFAAMDIHCIQVVYGCSMSKIKRIISDEGILKDILYNI